MHAYIYARFSTLEQAKGSSLARQLEDCRAFCDRQGWSRSIERELVDEGRSAFDGTNRAHGSGLADFERQAREGQLPHGTVLVVERLDRISRQSAFEVFTLISGLTEAGVAIATVDGERVYTRGNVDFGSLIELIVKAHVAHEESEKKSQRNSAAWMRKRDRAEAGDVRAITRRCPAWIAVDEHTQQYVLLEDRAAIVRRIFRLATSGHGKHLIARTLNAEHVPTWGRGEKGWHPSYVQKILSSRTTLGEYQPHTKSAGRREVAGSPITGMYPAVVDETTFARAQYDRVARQRAPGRKTRSFSNLFSGIARCAACKAAMTYVNKGRVGEQYLVCDNAHRGCGCGPRVHFNYPVLEAAIIDQTLHFALEDRHFSVSTETAESEAHAMEQQRILDGLRDRQSRLVDLLSRHDNREVEVQLHRIAEQILSAEAELSDLKSALTLAKGRASPRENIARIREMLSDIGGVGSEEATAAARGTTQQALRALITEILCDPTALVATVRFGTAQFQVDRRGAVSVPVGVAELGLSALADLRERGWIITKHASSAALGSGARAGRKRS